MSTGRKSEQQVRERLSRSIKVTAEVAYVSLHISKLRPSPLTFTRRNHVGFEDDWALRSGMWIKQTEGRECMWSKMNSTAGIS